ELEIGMAGDLGRRARSDEHSAGQDQQEENAESAAQILPNKVITVGIPEIRLPGPPFVPLPQPQRDRDQGNCDSQAKTCGSQVISHEAVDRRQSSPSRWRYPLNQSLQGREAQWFDTGEPGRVVRPIAPLAEPSATRTAIRSIARRRTNIELATGSVDRESGNS